MKSRIVRHLLVYSLALFALLGMGVFAKIYATASQQRLEDLRQKGLETTQNDTHHTKVKICNIFPLPLQDLLTLPGTIKASEDIDLAAKVSGPVEKLFVDEGDYLEAGEELLKVDLEVLEAQLQRAEAAYELARLKFDRTTNLFSQKVVSKDEYDEARANLKSASATVLETRALLQDGTLVSPINGFLDQRLVDQGEYISPGQIVMKIVDIDLVDVVCDVPEKDVIHFRKGQSAKVLFRNGEAKEATGTIRFLALVADPQSRTYKMKVAVDNHDQFLRPGMIVRVKLVKKQVEDGIAVPFFALVERDGGKVVYVVEDGVAKERQVETGLFEKGMVEITKGLVPGEALVVVGQRELSDNQNVAVTEDLTELARKLVYSKVDLSSLATQAGFLQN